MLCITFSSAMGSYNLEQKKIEGGLIWTRGDLEKGGFWRHLLTYYLTWLGAVINYFGRNRDEAALNPAGLQAVLCPRFPLPRVPLSPTKEALCSTRESVHF